VLTVEAALIPLESVRHLTLFYDRDVVCMAGSGGYADNRSGASSTTGHGEAFMTTCLAKHIAILMEQGEFF